jgi:hypothetical protein
MIDVARPEALATFGMGRRVQRKLRDAAYHCQSGPQWDGRGWLRAGDKVTVLRSQWTWPTSSSALTAFRCLWRKITKAVLEAEGEGVWPRGPSGVRTRCKLGRDVGAAGVSTVVPLHEVRCEALLMSILKARGRTSSALMLFARNWSRIAF